MKALKYINVRMGLAYVLHGTETNPARRSLFGLNPLYCYQEA